MNPIALITDQYVVYWNAIVIALGVLACFCLTMALFTAHGGRAVAVWLLLPLGILFSLPLARFFHWFCAGVDTNQSLWEALTDYSSGHYYLLGVVLGTALAALVVRALGFTQNLPRLFDCLAPGASLGIALIRLSEIFTVSDRSEVPVSNPLFQRLPFGVFGPGQWRYATFFFQFVMMLLIFVLLMRFFVKRRRWPMKQNQPRDGHVALMFVTWLSALDLVTDSSRYDASKMQNINGFVKLVQIAAAVALLTVLIIYSVRSIRANGLRPSLWVLWIVFFVALGLAGFLEWLVQRKWNWYLLCYSLMSLSMLTICFVNYRAYLSVCAKPDRR